MPYAVGPDRTKTFATDEILPLEPLAEMHNTFVVSKPDRAFCYRRGEGYNVVYGVRSAAVDRLLESAPARRLPPPRRRSPASG